MKPIHYSRKRRQLHHLVRKLQVLLACNKETSINQIEKVISKIQKLVNDLIHVLSHVDLKRILGTTAIYVGISFPFHVSAQSFAEPQLNPFGLTPTYYWAFPAFADLDGDGDLDLLVGEYYGSMQYFENTGSASNPQFAAPKTNPFGLDSTYHLAFPAFADLDGDGDIDLLVGEYYGAMLYFENTGSADNPQFAAPQLNPFGLDSTYAIAMPSFTDLDDDGDLDLFVGEDYGASLQYFENTGSAWNPQFAAPIKNPFGIGAPYDYLGAPTFADLDKDGDLDLLVGWGYYEGYLIYYENIGSPVSPSFAEAQISPFGLEYTYYLAIPTFVDLDADGDIDVLVGEYYGNMQYFENTETSPTESLSQSLDIKLFPNPVSDVLTIQSEENIVRIEIFNALGRVMGAYEITSHKINLEKLNAGIYIVKLTNEKGNYTTKKILKQ